MRLGAGTPRAHSLRFGQAESSRGRVVLPEPIPPPRSFLMCLSVTQLAGALQTVFTHGAQEAARETGFIKRKRQLTGPAFVQALTFGWLEDPQAPVEDLAALAGELGSPLSPSALDQRFTQAAADCLATVLGRALQCVLAARPAALPLLRRFNGVYLLDSTTVGLPAQLAPFLPGCGGSTPGAGKAALKLQVRWELTGCTLEGLDWDAGRSADTGPSWRGRSCRRAPCASPTWATTTWRRCRSTTAKGFTSSAACPAAPPCTTARAGSGGWAPSWRRRRGTASTCPCGWGPRRGCRAGWWPCACPPKWPASGSSGCARRQPRRAARSAPRRWPCAPG